MRLLTAHKILVAAAIGLGLVLIAWGTVHGLIRREPGASTVLGVGIVAVPLLGFYLRRLFRRPPIR